MHTHHGFVTSCHVASALPYWLEAASTGRLTPTSVLPRRDFMRDAMTVVDARVTLLCTELAHLGIEAERLARIKAQVQTANSTLLRLPEPQHM